MHAVAIEMEKAPEPHSTCIAFSNGSGEINRHKNSASSNGSSYNCQGVHRDVGGNVSQAVLAVAPWDFTDPGVPGSSMRNSAPKSDLTKAVPRRHFDLLDFVQESNVKANMRVYSNHMCRYCKRHFSSGRALGGHMRAHGSLFADKDATRLNIESVEKEQLSGSVGNRVHTHSDPSSENHARSLPSADSHMLSSAWVQFKEYNGNRSDFQRRGVFQTDSFEDLAMREEEDAMSVRGSSSSEAYNETEPSPDEEFQDDKARSVDDKVHPLYALRRNPKRSRRFTDQEFAFDASASIQISAPTAKRPSSPSPERARACSECGKEFLSWKALFGHMRCHPEREWRGIQPPDSAGQQDRAGSSLGVAGRRRRPAVYGSFGQDSGLELESDLENNKEGGETETLYERTVVEDTTIKRDGPVSNEVVEEEASSKRGEGEESNTRRGQGEEMNTLMVNALEGEERASNRKERKLSDNESDLESIQGGCMDTWSQRSFHGWITGKRSKRSRHTVRPLQIVTCQEPELDAVTTPTEIKEERDMADCLVMLAYAGRSLEEVGRTERQLTEESTFSDSGRNWMAEQGGQRTDDDSEEEEMNWIGKSGKVVQRSGADKETDEASLCEDRKGGVDDVRQKGIEVNLMKYECSTCKRIFHSHQALGGHRASHRKVKGCFARNNTGEEVHESTEDLTDEEYVRLEDEVPTREPQLVHEKEGERSHGLQWGDDKHIMASTAGRTFKGHECSICHRVFASGQALGGHKRCHWTGERITETASVASSNKQASSTHGGQKRVVKEDFLDLNLPAPLDDDDDMEVAYGMAEVVPAYSRLLDAKRAEESMQVHGITGVKRDYGRVPEGGRPKEQRHLCTGESLSLNEVRRLEDNARGCESQEFGRRNDQVQLNFSNRFVHCNVCDSIFTSLEAFSNHQKTHASLMSSVAGLTPISA